MVFGDMGNRKNSPDVRSGRDVEQGAPLCASCLPMTGWAVLSYGENPSFLHGGTVPHCSTAKTRLFCVMGLGIIGSCATGAMPERDWLL